MGELGFPELLIILVIALVVFGGKRLPGVARGLGESIREFQKALRGGQATDDPPLPRETPK